MPSTPRVDGPAGVVGVADALEQERQRGERAQPGQIVPVQRWLPKIMAQWPVAACRSSSGGAASRERKTGSEK